MSQSSLFFRPALIFAALLRRTRSFLIREGVSPSAPSAGGETPFSLGHLNLIKYRANFPLGKRSAVTLDDWLLLEEKQDGLQRLFNVELQRRFRLYSSQLIITLSPILLLILAFFFLLLAIFPPLGSTPRFSLATLFGLPAWVGWARSASSL